MRSADTMAACITVYLAPRSRIGRKKRLVYSRKATRPPNVSAPRHHLAAAVPQSSATAAEPIASTDA